MHSTLRKWGPARTKPLLPELMTKYSDSSLTVNFTRHAFSAAERSSSSVKRYARRSNSTIEATGSAPISIAEPITTASVHFLKSYRHGKPLNDKAICGYPGCTEDGHRNNWLTDRYGRKTGDLSP